MVNDQQKYRSEICKIIGFTLMTPLGRIILDPMMYKKFDITWFVVYICFSILICSIGIITLVIGHDILDPTRRKS